MNFFETVFPRQANNDYKGSPIAFYGFLLVVATQSFSGLVHYFTYDSGKVQIAGLMPLQGTPDPSGLIFALGANAGAWELIILAIYGVVSHHRYHLILHEEKPATKQIDNLWATYKESQIR